MSASDFCLDSDKYHWRGIQPSMNRLKTVIDNTASPVSTECDVKLSAISVLCIVDIFEGCNVIGNWQSVNGEQQGTRHTALRYSIVAADR